MDMPFMTVGNPGNAGELSGAGAGGGGDRICGAVDYEYNIGKFEVTTGQYTEFLNAVAATDPYGLYNPYMWSLGDGCGIERAGSVGTYTYSVAADYEDRPVNFVAWTDAARFCNWLTNGRPTGAQTALTTENGSYDLSGIQSYYGPDGTTPYMHTPEWDAFMAAIAAVTRKADAQHVLPNEDEWYKAAYHKNDGVTGNYWVYPTSTDAPPLNDLIDPDPGNSANFGDGPDRTIGSPYYRTEVGEFKNPESPYGTFDQGGNVKEWTEEPSTSGSIRLRRGGDYVYGYLLDAAYRYGQFPERGHGTCGFRVAEVPEPATTGLLAFGGLAIVKRRR